MKILTVLLSVLILLAACNQASKQESSKDKALEVEEFQGENVGSKLDLFVKSFLDSQNDIRNNDIALEKAQIEFSKTFRPQVENGILDGMIFKTLMLHKELRGDKVKATFTCDAVSKDSTYAITVFVDAIVKEDDAVKIKEFTDYKIEGKMTMAEDKYGSMINLRKEINKKTKKYDCIDISVHNVKINLANFTEVLK